jgi:hypothetical protein
MVIFVMAALADPKVIFEHTISATYFVGQILCRNDWFQAKGLNKKSIWS